MFEGTRRKLMIKNKLYNETVTLTFDALRHRYFWEEEKKEVTSVTTILDIINKPALIPWAVNCTTDYIFGNEEKGILPQILPGKSYDEIQLHSIREKARSSHSNRKKDAGDIGTFLHKWVEKYIKGEKPEIPVNPELQVAVLNFLIWVKNHKVKFLLSEQMVFSKKYGYPGTIDFICTIDGEMYVGDLKTSSGIYAEMLLQTSGYRHARVEEFPEEKYVGQLIVRIGKDGTFEFLKIKDTDVYKIGDREVTGKQLYEYMFKGFISTLTLFKVLDVFDKYRKSI
jgi:hypothetical protein